MFVKSITENVHTAVINNFLNLTKEIVLFKKKHKHCVCLDKPFTCIQPLSI